jgi:protein-tyrosine phosphatase
MHFITDSLLVGNSDDAREPAPFVSGLLLVAGEYQVQPQPWVSYHVVPLKEFAAVDPHDLQQAVEWLERQVPSGRVMVCCRAGMGRSVSVAIAYLCCVERMTYEDAVKLVSARRPGAAPIPNLKETIQEVQRMRQKHKQSTEPRDLPTDPAHGRM